MGNSYLQISSLSCYASLEPLMKSKKEFWIDMNEHDDEKNISLYSYNNSLTKMEKSMLYASK